MKKSVIIVVIAVLVFIGIYIFNKSSVPTDLEQANVSDTLKNNDAQNSQEIDLSKLPSIKNLKFSFTGYGPAGKFHNGTFGDYSVTGNIFTIKTATVNADAGSPEFTTKLNTHLCSNDFFNCAMYPEIVFSAEKVIKKSDSEYEASGSLKFRDITKQVTFKVTTENGTNFSSDFLLDTSEFNFNPKFVTNEVRIKFSFEI